MREPVITGVIYIEENSITPDIVTKQVLKNSCSNVETKASNETIEMNFKLNDVLDFNFLLDNYRKYSINRKMSLSMRIAGKTIDLKSLK